MSIIPEGSHLFVIDIEYLVALQQVEPFLEPHMKFVDKGYESGCFLFSGPKVPRTGGVIIAQAKDRAGMEAFMEMDPFSVEKLAVYKITEILPRNMAKILSEL